MTHPYMKLLVHTDPLNLEHLQFSVMLLGHTPFKASEYEITNPYRLRIIAPGLGTRHYSE